MTVQTGLAAEIAFEAEAAFGVKPAAPAGRLLRRVSTSLHLAKTMLRSDEVRGDAQLAVCREGLRRVEGELRGELAPGAWDDFLAAGLRGAWQTGASFAAAPGAGVTADTATRTFTRAAGSWLDDGFKTGDVVRWSGLSAGNDGRNLRVEALTAVAMTVAEAVETVAAPEEGCACAVAGAKAMTGTAQPSFTIEQHYADAGFSQVFTGCRVARLQLGLSPNGLATVAFTVAGRDMEIIEDADAPFFAAPAAPGNVPPLAAVDGLLRLGGRDLGIVTGLDLRVDLNVSAEPVVGARDAAALCYGRTEIGGTVTAFLEDAALLAAFAAGEEAALHALLAAPGAEPRDFVALHLPRLVFTGGEVLDRGQEGMPVRLPFQALLRTDGGPGTAWDKAAMVVQRGGE